MHDSRLPHDHGHDHEHDHDHDHGHDHEHDHEHATPEAMPFAAKLIKRLEHWHRHNEDHLADYRRWATQAEGQGHPGVAAGQREVAALTRRISDQLARTLTTARSRE